MQKVQRALPLSFSQQRLWFLEQLNPGKSLYNEHVAFRLKGALQEKILARSLSEIVHRHEILRTTFVKTDGELLQQIAMWRPLELKTIDLQGLPAEERETLTRRLAEAAVKYPFDFTHGPLFRASLFRLAKEEHILLTALHHTIGDGWSMNIFYHELSVLYEAYRRGKASPLPELPLQYADYTLWQQQLVQGEVLQKELNYWEQQLKGAQKQLSLPTDRPRPAVQTYAGASQSLRLPGKLLQQLKALSRSEGVMLFMTLLAAFQVLLMRYSGQQDILVGSLIANRPRRELEGLIGFFANTVVLRADVSGNPGFKRMVQRVREVTLAAYDHQALPFEKLVAHLEAERDLSRHPLFQAALLLQNFSLSTLELSGISWSQLELTKTTSKFDLLMTVGEEEEGLFTSIEYSTDLFEPATIERFLACWQVLLEAIVHDANTPIEHLSLLGEAEREQALTLWNATRRDYPQQCSLHELFEQQVTLHPDAIAVTFEDGQLSYHELNRRANQLAYTLRSLHIGPDMLVGVSMLRSLELMIALLAVLKAGAAYVPFDPEYPQRRLAAMFQDAQITVLLTQNALRQRCPVDDRVIVFSVDTQWSTCSQQPVENPSSMVLPEQLAYMIYTSGSTGTPKGAMNTHRGITNRLLWMQEQYQLTALDRVLQKTPYSFDVSVWEFFWPLMAGASVVLARPGGQQDPGYLKAVLKEQEITTLHFVPSMLQAFLGEPGLEQWQSVRQVMCSGEALSVDLQARFFASVPQDVHLHNLYGPTEAAVDVSFWRCQPGGEHWTVPIGRPIANTQLYVLDRWLQPVPVGVAGELFIGGVGLARGYWRRAALTAEKFVPHPFSEKPGERLYRTGDLVRQAPDGTLEFLGRIDQQVKVRGHRIELGEIEAVLSQDPAVKECVVVVREDVPGDRLLVAYMSLSDSASSVEAVKQRAKMYLPAYMQPALFVSLQAFPLTHNGKIDRRALPVPERDSVGLPGSVYIAPRTELEQRIVAAWREALPIAQIGLNDNFFDLGGHSLSLVKVHERLRANFKPDLTLVDLFQYPTVAALAHFLRSEGSVDHFQSVAQQNRVQIGGSSNVRSATQGTSLSQKNAGSEHIAIIGLAGRFPKAKDVQEFWHNLQHGVEAISFFSHDELIAAGIDPELFNDPNYVRAGAVLEDIELFDAAFFGYTPREAEIIDPQQRLLLECSWQALEDAGYDAKAYVGKIGIFAGASINTYLISNLLRNRTITDAMSFYQLLVGSGNDFLTTRVSYKLNLRGPSMTVQTACSTSLVAVHMACESLRTGACDMVLAGGVSVRVPQRTGYLYEKGGILSPDGHCRAFDVSSQGTVGGEGVGVVLLKRLDEAVRDGDSIYAVIKGSAINNDGSAKVGYTAPSIQGQAEVIAEALAMAQIEPESVSYIEAHGTGTPIGDPIELAALRQVYKVGGANKHCTIGSVKTNIGHLDAAAGIAGLLKTVLALQHQQLPPSLFFKEANPALALSNSPFSINTALRPWIRNRAPRRAGVSSFGIGGTNAHVILEEAPPPETPPIPSQRPSQLLVLSARSEVALHQARINLAHHLRQHPSLELADVAYTLQAGRQGFKHRLAAVCSDLDEAIQALSEPVSSPGVRYSTATETHVTPVFLFSGQGTQYVHMGAGLYQTEPAFRTAIDTCAEILEPHLRLDLRRMLYPDANHADFCTRRLNQTWLTQPALFAIEYALAQLWQECGIAPEAMMGHSVGEYVAACLAGVFSLADALRLVAARGHLMQGLPGGAMLMVAQKEAEVLNYLRTDFSKLSLAAHNGETNCVLSGPFADIERLEQQLNEQGIFCRRLQTSHAFHSQMMDPILDRFRLRVQEVTLRPPHLAYISNVTGTWITAEQATDPGYWVEHLRQPVRFADGLHILLRDQACLLLEVGPGRTLNTLVQRHPARTELQPVLASLRSPGDQHADRAFFLKTCGQLWCAGVPLKWAGLYTGEQRRRVPLPTYPFERKRYWVTPDMHAGQRTLIPAPQAEPVLTQSIPEASNRNTHHYRPELSTSYHGPRSALEQRLVSIWQTLLGIEQIGIHDNFFELNGDSLLATRVTAHIRKELHLEIPLSVFFEMPTILDLGHYIERVQAEQQNHAEPALMLVERSQQLPLSFAQQRLWFLDQLTEENIAYNIANAFLMLGEPNVAVLEKCFQELVRRHESLRTTFRMVDEHPVQTIGVPIFSLPVVDISGLPETQREALANTLARQHARTRFDLQRGPLFQVALIRQQQDAHLFLLAVHHIVADGWSMSVLERELVQMYSAFVRGEESPLAPLHMQYADFALWQRRLFQEGQVLPQQLSYWQKQLASVVPLDLPTDHPRPAVQSSNGAHTTACLPLALAEALQTLSQREGVTLFMTLLAGFLTLLYRYTGQTDIAVGTPIANRTDAELENLVGFFVNTLVLRSQLDTSNSFLHLLAQVREMALQAYAHQDIPFEQVVEAMQPERDLSRTPLFQVLFVLQNMPRVGEQLTGLQLHSLGDLSAVAKFDLTLFIVETPQGLSCTIEYNTDLFEDSTIRRFLGHFQTLLEAIVASPQSRLAELSPLSQAERKKMLLLGRGDPEPVAQARCIHDLLEGQATRTRDSIAVAYQGEQLSYGELDRRANQLAHFLQKQGVGPDVLVGICLPRSLELVIAIVGVLKAGGAYVPLDPDHPTQRLEMMLTDADVRVLLTRANQWITRKEQPCEIIDLGQHWREILQEPMQPLAQRVLPDNLAYVIYTSGSTGKPKGVLVSHRNLVASTKARQTLYQDAITCCLLSYSFAFDGSVVGIFWTLSQGGTLLLPPPAFQQDLALLQDLIAQHHVSHLLCVPSLYNVLLSQEEISALSVLRYVIVGGESCSVELVVQHHERLKGTTFINEYGPTEGTVWCTAYQSKNAVFRSQVPIGRPIPGAYVYLLDRWLQPVPPGVTGEIYIGGAGIARGYLHRGDLTAERFVPDPFSEQEGMRLYRTGDRARYLEDGNIVFLGRADDQVKLRGYRIELGEIEAVLMLHPQVRQNVVILRDITSNEKRLVAYVVAEEGGRSSKVSAGELRSFLKGKLPDYMLPAHFVVLDALPLTSGGKVDRKALPEPDAVSQGLAGSYVAPRTPVEQVLADTWTAILHLKQVGIHDNFFSLGGDSILSMQMINRLSKAGLHLTLKQLFQHQTIEEIANAVETATPLAQAEQGIVVGAVPLSPVPRDRNLLLSFAQQRLWFLQQLEPGSAAYNVSGAVRLRGRLESAVLARALDAVIRRHESLRTTFSSQQGVPVQVIASAPRTWLTVVDLSQLAIQKRELIARQLARQEAAQPFDLARGSLLRSFLLSISEQDRILLLTMHHIISDGWSIGILARELTILYAALLRGEKALLPNLPVQYADYALWQRSWLQGETLEALLSYWTRQLRGASPLELPTDRPRHTALSHQGAVSTFTFPARLAHDVRALSHKEGATLFITLFSTFQILLHRYTRREDIVVGTDIANRNHTQTEGIIGFFVNLLVLRTRIHPQETFRDVLKYVSSVALNAYMHQDLPFEQLVEALLPDRTSYQTPLVNVLFVMQETPLPALHLQEVEIAPLDIDNHTAKFDLAVFMTESEQTLTCTVNYRTDLFNADTIARLVSHFQNLLQSVISSPDISLVNLKMYSDEETSQHLSEKTSLRENERDSLKVARRTPLKFSSEKALKE